MIRKVDLPEQLAPFCRTPFGCRIRSTVAAYGLDEHFAQVWTQENRAALCMLDDTMILDVPFDADFDEISEFIRMSGAKRLVCSAAAGRRTGFPTATRGEIMVFQNRENQQPTKECDWSPSLREIYLLLTQCASESFVPPEFEPFYMDLSHRIRHDAALAAGIREGDTLVACAVCTAKDGEQAVISAVAVHPEYRRKGNGLAVLSALIGRLKQREIYIYRAQGENEAFYKAFGFVSCGAFEEQNIKAGAG